MEKRYFEYCLHVCSKKAKHVALNMIGTTDFL